MITKQVIKTCIDELKELSKIDFCVIDSQGLLMSSTFNEAPDVRQMLSFFDSPADSQIINGITLFKIKDENDTVFVLAAGGNQADSYIFGKVCVNELEHLLVAYREQFDTTVYFQNLLLDNLLLVDIYSRAKKLHIPIDANRVVQRHRRFYAAAFAAARIFG